MIRSAPAIAAFAAAVLLAPGVAGAQVRSLDLDRFDGRWFEVERSPNDVQKTCWRARIDFTPQQRAGRYSVLVTCTRTQGGPVETLRANARATDETNAKLRFSLDGLLGFGGLAGQTYWVWERDPEYRWTVRTGGSGIATPASARPSEAACWPAPAPWAWTPGV